MRCPSPYESKTDRASGIKIAQSTVLGSCYPSGITTVSLSFRTVRALRLGSTVNDRCYNKDQIASGLLGLKGAHGVASLSRSLRTSVTLRKMSSSIPDVSTVDDRPFCFLP